MERTDDNPWLRTMKDLLTKLIAWIPTTAKDRNSWELSTATAHMCMAEMKAVTAVDGMCERLDEVIPHLEAAVVALDNRQREQAIEHLKLALAAFGQIDAM